MFSFLGVPRPARVPARLQPSRPWSDHVSLWLGSLRNERFSHLGSDGTAIMSMDNWSGMKLKSTATVIENVPSSIDCSGSYTVARTTMVACYLAECSYQLMSPTATEIWDERELWSVGGNVRTCSKLILWPPDNHTNYLEKNSTKQHIRMKN